MTNVDLMKEFLSSQGFKYEQDEDNDIFFKYQMRNFIFMGSDNDETFLRLVMPGVFDDIIPRVLDILLAAQQEFYKQIN